MLCTSIKLRWTLNNSSSRGSRSQTDPQFFFAAAVQLTSSSCLIFIQLFQSSFTAHVSHHRFLSSHFSQKVLPFSQSFFFTVSFLVTLLNTTPLTFWWYCYFWSLAMQDAGQPHLSVCCTEPKWALRVGWRYQLFSQISLLLGRGGGRHLVISNLNCFNKYVMPKQSATLTQ